MAETVNDVAAVAATQRDVIDMQTLQLLGVMQANDGLAALIRSAAGEIARVSVGDVAFGITITAIGDDSVILTNGQGQTEALAIPQG
jgi:Tfp pilus assembly protein PilP